MKLKELVDERHFPLWGVAGSLVGLVVVLIPQLYYEGSMGEPFSVFNHAVSELGELGVSELAWMFNVGLIITGILLIPFMIGLGLLIDNFFSKIAAIGGVYSAVSIALVGVYPMNYTLEHSIVGVSFFLSGMFMILLWAIAIIVQKEVRINKVLSIGGFVDMIIFALFLYEPWEGFGESRPEFSMKFTLEWAAYLAIVGYLLVLSLYVWRKEKNVESSQ